MTRIAALAIVLLTSLAFVGGWHLRGQRAGREQARLHQQHSAALADALANARAIEQRLISDLESLHRDTQQQMAAAVDASRRAADERVRDIAAQYATRHRTAARDSAAAGQCQAAATAAGMLAELLGELDTLAEHYAAEADRRRIAGLACESAYRIGFQGGAP